jgi:hypothetical protein
MDIVAAAEHPQSEQPEHMQRYHKRIVRSAKLDATGGKQPHGVPLRETELGKSLHNQEPMSHAPSPIYGSLQGLKR